VFKMFNGKINWMIKRHEFIATSTKKLEYMATTHGRKKLVWLQRLCSWIRFDHRGMKINCDSQSTIFLEKTPAYHSETKHNDVQYNFVRDMVESNTVVLKKVNNLNIVDSLTKSLSDVNFYWCGEEMGIVSLDL
jgi:hypothetical protein